ncbi:MAG: alpha-amylase family glycosyl hydrolase, partial [Polyangiaceae bacterium]
FQLIDAPWHARGIAAMIAEYEAALPPGAWPNWVLGNHDRPRIAARLGDAQARVAAMLLLTLRGTPTLYYGDELGIGSVEIPHAQVQDPRELREPGLGLGRDPARTPMPWDATPHAGFTTGTPWLPLNQDWPERNVQEMGSSSRSLLALYRQLLALRRAHRALSLGAIALLDATGNVLAYERRSGDERLLVVLNLGDAPEALTLPLPWRNARVLLSTLGDEEHRDAQDRIALRPAEGVILAAPEAT